MTAGLSVTGLSFTYGPKQALDDVSLTIAPGTFCALLGPNGAGKSTLVSLLTRLLVSPVGEIQIAGHDLRRSSGQALAQLGVVFQQPTLDLSLTVHQNLAYFAALQGLPRALVPARIAEALDRLGMAERAGEKASALNGGHRRRMELARALLHQPKVMLLDEPTVGLDAAARRSITDYVHELTSQGLSVLWTTHVTDEVKDTDHLAVLHQGRIVANGIAGEVRGNSPLADWFLAKTGAPA